MLFKLLAAEIVMVSLPGGQMNPDDGVTLIIATTGSRFTRTGILYEKSLMQLTLHRYQDDVVKVVDK